MLMPFENLQSENEDFIPLSVPEIRGNEWKYVKECLDSGWVSSAGQFVDRFEQMVADYVGARYAVATVNGTTALHIALLVAGVQPDNEVLVPSLTFIAPANAVRYVGAWPVFMDAEVLYWQMDPAKVWEFLETECRWRHGALWNKRTGRRVRAILPVHILGHPVDMAPIVEAAAKYDLVVIEDASQSLGAVYKGAPVGRLGHIACFSFNGNKIVTAAGGGMIVTDNEAWASRARYLTTQARDDLGEYIHTAIGYNYRLSNLQAAVGCAQLERLSDHIAAKRRIASAYAEALSRLTGVTPMREAPWAVSIYWMYAILVDAPRFGMDRSALRRCFEAAAIETRPLWQPLHRSPAHRSCQSYRCETADGICRDALSLPSSVGLSCADQQRVIEVLKQALGSQ